MNTNEKIKNSVKPILFSTSMVQAILKGRKTQTRREVKFPFDWDGKTVYPNGSFGLKYGKLGYDGIINRLRPKYEVGTVLWVRETCQCVGYDENYIDYKNGYWIYRADNPSIRYLETFENFKWKPSIFMPKEACRLFLKVTDIRVERLQDISESDAIAEGVGAGFQMNAGYPDYEHIVNGVCTLTQDTAYASFISLWQKINGNWDENPFVWAYEFEKTSRPENF